jgi:uncharacterized protein
MKPRYRDRAESSRASFRHDRRVLALPPDRDLVVAVVADTHAAPHPKLAGHLQKLAPDAILHGGDIGSGQVLDDLAALAPLYAVRGNIDDASLAQPDALTLRLQTPAQLGTDEAAFALLLVHIAVAGPRLRKEVATLARDEGASLVVCGHSHVPFLGRDQGLTIFNPGSIGPRRMHLPILFGELRVGKKVSLRHIGAETGETWLPPAPTS